MNKAIIICFYIAMVQGAILPSYITKCNPNVPEWNTCLTNVVNKIWPTFLKGDKTMHLASFDPMQVDFLNIDVDGNLSLNIRKTNFYGLKDAKFNYIKMDMDKKTIDIEFYCDDITALGNYRINGKLLALPIMGDGNINVTYVGGTYDYHLDFEMKPDKKGQDHIFITKSTLTYAIKKSRISLTNLFNNAVLSDQMNVVLNDNWKEVDLEIGVKVGNGFGEVLTAALQAFFKKMPWEDMIIQAS